MRKHLYLVTEHEDDERVGGCKIIDSRLTRPTKNNEGPITVLDHDEEGFRQAGKMVGMGYADFEDVEDYEERIADVMQEKLADIDDEHLEKAGVKELVTA